MPGITRTKVIGYTQALKRLEAGEVIMHIHHVGPQMNHDTLRYDAFRRLWKEGRLKITGRAQMDVFYSLKREEE